MLPYFTAHFGNAASTLHAHGWKAKAAIEFAREQVAELIHAEPEEIIFTSGSTESINMALRGVFHAYHQKGNHIITCKTEHKAVLDTCKDLEKLGADVTYLNVNHEGLIDIEELKSAFTQQTILVAIMMANNETGVVHPIEHIGKICHEKGVICFSDTTQAPGKIAMDVNEMHTDLICISAHKFYGPKGSGALYVRRKNPRVKLKPIITGGGHENGMRSGTLNVPGIVGLGAACAIAGTEQWNDAANSSILRTQFEQFLVQQLTTSINGNIKNRLPNTTNICFNGISAEGLIKELPELSFSTGSACTSALPEPSHVLKAMGLSDKHCYGSARFSLCKYSTMNEVTLATDAIVKAVKKLLQAST